MPVRVRMKKGQNSEIPRPKSSLFRFKRTPSCGGAKHAEKKRLSAPPRAPRDNLLRALRQTCWSPGSNSQTEYTKSFMIGRGNSIIERRDPFFGVFPVVPWALLSERVAQS